MAPLRATWPSDDGRDWVVHHRPDDRAHHNEEASPTPVSATGTSITYSFTVTNNGNVTMSNVVLADLQTTPNTDTLASGPTCTSLTGPAGACSGNVVTLAPGQVANYTATLITNQNDLNAGSIADSATATGKTPASVTPVQHGAQHRGGHPDGVAHDQQVRLAGDGLDGVTG